MAILHALLLVLSMAVLQPTKSEIDVPFSTELYVPFVDLNIFCNIKNEHFIGWFKVGSNIKIPVVPRRADAKGKPAVVIEARVGTLEKTCTLIIPRGVGFRSATGRYICKGQRNQGIVVVQSRLTLHEIQTTQHLYLGTNATIILGAFSYPHSRFQWRKDNVSIDFSQDRFALQDDGSIHIFNVQESDAGVYDVNINWENRLFKDIQITVSTASVSEVFVPFTEATLKPKFGLSIVCYIRNEHFIGWFKANSKIKIPVVASKADVKDEPAVVIATVSNKTTEALMIFPRGSPVSNAGKYVCTGGIHRAVVKVISKII